MGDNLFFTERGSNGLVVYRGITNPSAVFVQQNDDKKFSIRTIQFSNSGQYFCYCDSIRTVLLNSSSFEEIAVYDLPRTQSITFSPKDRTMVLFEPYAIYVNTKLEEAPKPPPNLQIFSLPYGKSVAKFTATKQVLSKIEWTDDEVYSIRLVGSEIFINKYNEFAKYESKVGISLIGDFALSHGSEPHHFAAYIRASGGQPASVQLRRLDHKFTIVSSKTFFKCDRANLDWNSKGSALLILTSVDVDKSNQSYYGEQNVCLMGVNGESFNFVLEKKGPIYCAKWNPSGQEFVLCYGFMPARVAVYNLKGEKIADLGEGPRNELLFNRFGTILIVGGFGNISSGNMEFWDAERKTQLIKIEVPNTTYLEWAPDGQHLLTATTSPRLRIDNCYRIWHYTGRLAHEKKFANVEELWQVQWRFVAGGVYNRFPLAALTSQEKANAGLIIESSDSPGGKLPAGSVFKSGAYIPPHLRDSSVRKGALTTSLVKKNVVTENQKKIRSLQKKIDDIAKLKLRKENGENLEANQMEKINKELEFLQEIEMLKSSEN